MSDLHLWRLGPGHVGLIAAVVSDRPQAPAVYKRRLDGIAGLSHVTIEVHACEDHKRKGGMRCFHCEAERPSAIRGRIFP